MARPKGVIQSRNEEKYWLPVGVVLSETNPSIYRKETKLVFIDSKYGEFISDFKSLQLANASTHSKAVQDRREKTNLEKYGAVNPHGNIQVREKYKKTMTAKYGVINALEHPEFLKKSQDTLEINHGVRNTMDSSKLKQKMIETNITKYGVSNPMKTVEVQERLKKTTFELYGVTNVGRVNTSIEKSFETLQKNGHNGRLCSKGEKEILDFIHSLGITSAQKGFIGGATPKELDIKIKDLNIAIEYHGAYWHCEIQKNFDKNGHLNKMLLCQAKGLKLLQFFDFEWIKRNFQVRSFLTSALGKNQIKINGRKTEIREVNKKDARDFLEKYHILGSCAFKKAFGLYFENELVSMITINKHHRNFNEMVLNRYVGKYNITVRGGLNKLCKAASSEFGKITTWIDLRMSDGKSWEKSGWKKISILKPDYFYFNNKTGEIISKQSRKKSIVKTPADMTEHQHALIDGLYRIYDCGKIKLVYHNFHVM